MCSGNQSLIGRSLQCKMLSSRKRSAASDAIVFVINLELKAAAPPTYDVNEQMIQVNEAPLHWDNKNAALYLF